MPQVCLKECRPAYLSYSTDSVFPEDETWDEVEVAMSLSVTLLSAGMACMLPMFVYLTACMLQSPTEHLKALFKDHTATPTCSC